MIDLASAYELRDVLSNEVIDSIIDEFGNIWYESFKLLLASGVPPITLLKSKGVNLVDYKIYGNGVQGVGNKTSNLYDFTDTSQLEKLDYTATAQRWGYNLGVLPSGDYTISFELVNNNNVPASVYIRKKDSTGSLSTTVTLTTSEVRNNPATFTTDGSSEYYFLFASGSVSNLAQAIERINLFKWIKIENGKVATGFEPFGYKIPIISRGKNLFDMNDLLANGNIHKDENGDYIVGKYTNSFSLSSDLVKKVVSALKPNTKYTISREAYGVESNASAEGQIRLMASGEVLTRISKANGLTSSTYTFTQEQIDSITHIYIYGNNTGNPVTYKSIQIEEGDLTEYEPYIEPIITEIYLNEPLKENEYISYKEDNLPSIPTHKGTTVIDIDTSVLPSNMEIVYYGKGKNILLNDTENIILNSILATNTYTEKDITDIEINEILDEIIGG